VFDLRVSRHGRFNYAENPTGKKKFTLEKAHEGLEGEQSYCCTRSLTSALDGGGW